MRPAAERLSFWRGHAPCVTTCRPATGHRRIDTPNPFGCLVQTLASVTHIEAPPCWTWRSRSSPDALRKQKGNAKYATKGELYPLTPRLYWPLGGDHHLDEGVCGQLVTAQRIEQLRQGEPQHCRIFL